MWLREISTIKLLSMPMILGGPGVVVQIDEPLFCHKPNVGWLLFPESGMLFYHRGRPWRYGYLVWRINLSLQLRDTWKLLVHEMLPPSFLSFRHHDTFWSMECIQQSGISTNSWVPLCHSLHFVDPATRTHTQNIRHVSETAEKIDYQGGEYWRDRAWHAAQSVQQRQWYLQCKRDQLSVESPEEREARLPSRETILSKPATLVFRLSSWSVILFHPPSCSLFSLFFWLQHLVFIFTHAWAQAHPKPDPACH